MVDKSQAIIAQEAVDNEPINKSEMCIGQNSTMMTLPSNVVTGCSQQFSMSYTPLPQLSFSRSKQPAPPSGLQYMAMLDYTAAIDDKVSFTEDCFIVVANTNDVEERVECTSQHRMLPSRHD